MTLVASISFASGAVLPVREMSVTMAEGRHEVATITVPDETPDSSKFRSGSPVTISWGYGKGDQAVMVGYVANWEPAIERGATDAFKRTMSVMCMGASFRLKDADYEVHRGVTASYVAKRVAEKFRFDVAGVEDSPTLHDMLPQQGKSYWAYLQWMASQVGYVVWCRNTTLYFTSRRAALATSRGAFIPLVQTNSGPGTLLNFTPRSGRWAPEGQRAERMAHGINPRTGSTFGATNKGDDKALFGSIDTPLFTAGTPEMALGTLDEMRTSLAASERGTQQHITAEAVVRGDARLRVGAAALVSTPNSGVDSGLWYISEATHTLRFGGDGESYTTKVKLLRDAYEKQLTPVLQGPATLRGSRLLNDRWVAA